MQSNVTFSRQAGFTLIEVLIAIAIFSIGLMAVGALQARSLMATGDVTRKTEAWALLADQVAQLKTLPFYQDVGAQTFPPRLNDTANAFVNDGNFQMNGTYTVWRMVQDDAPIGPQPANLFAEVPAGTYTVCKTIRVVITLPGGNAPANGIADAQFIKTWAATGIDG